MSTLHFKEVSDPLTAADLAAIENQLGISLPLPLKEHFLKYNGGYPEKDNYIWSDGTLTTINCFGSFKSKGFFNIEALYIDLVVAENYISSGILPFATDDGGNFFCISCRKIDTGFIYYFNHDHYDVTSKEKALTLVDRKGFSHFIENFEVR
jgi:cell wall assembly regulator SMI1